MTIPGYDPDDVESALEARLSGRELATFLTEAEVGRYEAGADLVDLLDDEDIERLLER